MILLDLWLSSPQSGQRIKNSVLANEVVVQLQRHDISHTFLWPTCVQFFGGAFVNNLSWQSGQYVIM